MSILLHPGFGNQRLLVASLLPLPLTMLTPARRHGHPHFTVETDEAPPGASYFRGPAGRFASREPDSSPQGGAA